MKRTTMDIRTGMLFPSHFFVVAGAFLLIAIAVAASKPLVAIGLVAGSLLILTAWEGTDVDPEAGALREYHSFFFLKTGNFRQHGGLESI